MLEILEDGLCWMDGQVSRDLPVQRYWYPYYIVPKSPNHVPTRTSLEQHLINDHTLAKENTTKNKAPNRRTGLNVE